ncbi:predicted protein, partial [Nematostella vectensis]
TVSGVILDKEFNNEPLPFANVLIKGTTIGTSTDDLGKYSLSVKPGSYVLEIGYLGYETKEIPFTIKAGEKKVINHTLEASGVQLADVVVTHTVTKESETALLQEQQKAVEIKQAIGAEEISKKGISDVAAAVAKTTGISKQEGSGSIYVRGLGDSSSDYNFDLKWEYFPKNGEVISVTGFGKYILNPINEATVASATNDISWVNSGEKAIGIGAEFELRKNIINIENSTNEQKTNLSGGLNISYLHTNQDLDTEKVLKETERAITVAFTNTESRLTGASDLLINADLSFNKDFSEEKSLTATLAGTYFSDRIYALGVTGKGDLVDSDVIALDFVLKYKFNKNLGIGFSAKNITDPTIERKQDIQNVIVDSYKKGRNFSISLKYTF